MKQHLFPLALLAALVCGPALHAQDSFRVRVDQPQHGKVTVTPAIPESGIVPAGTVLKVKVDVTDPGWVFDSGYELSVTGGMFYPTYKESMQPEFTVKVDHPIMSIGASIIEAERLQGYRTIQDVVYAQPGVKPLKYDVFIPDGAKKLPCIVIIHGGGWSSNTEDIMRGLARELIKGGKYVVASIDYRWLNQGDGDKVPVRMHQLIEDCYGAILHIQEHAAEYGVNPKKIAVTGDSAGGHLSACMIDLVERVGDGGFGVQPDVYQYLPTYMPAGWSAAKAKKSLRAIKAAAPSYGVFDLGTLVRFADDYDSMGLVAITPDCNVPRADIRKVPQYMVLGTLDRTVGRKPMEDYLLRLKGRNQDARLDIVEGASHAFFDWKPDQRTKDTFAKYGVPYAAKMKAFFDEVFYK
jgi:acetyl esterase/lipase